MIESAMMFALGVFVSGLLALTFFGAYARRTRRVVERRLRARMSVGRAEIDAERDELRARHAVEVRRLEREIGHLRDQATASRLDGDVKEQELTGLRAEIEAMTADIADYEERLDELLEQLHEVERESAERAGTIRALQFEVEREEEYRAQIEEALSEASDLARQRWIEGERLFAENAELRALMERAGPQRTAKTILDPRPAAVADFIGPPKKPRAHTDQHERAHENAVPPVVPAAGKSAQAAHKAHGGHDEAAMARMTDLADRDPAAEPDKIAGPDKDAGPEPARIGQIATQVNRIAGGAAADLFRVFRRKKPAAPLSGATDTEAEPSGLAEQDDRAREAAAVTDLSAEREARRQLPSRSAGVAAEAQLMSAVEEIRALQKTGDGGSPQESRPHPPRDVQAGE